MMDWADIIAWDITQEHGLHSVDANPFDWTSTKIAAAIRKAKADGMRIAANYVQQNANPILSLSGMRCDMARNLDEAADKIESGKP